MLAQNASRPHSSTTSANVQLGERGVCVGDNNSNHNNNNNNNKNNSQPTFVYRSLFDILPYYNSAQALPPLSQLIRRSLSRSLSRSATLVSPAPSAAVFR